MATISRENIGKLTDKLTVALSKEDYLPAFEQSLKKYAKTANIPGFRKGMVPAGMIKKMYGTGVFTEEVLRAVDNELNKYMQEQQLEIFGQPLPLDTDARQLDMNNPSDYMFAFEIGLKPPIEVDVKNITVTRNRVNVSDKMIEDEVERLKNRYGKMSQRDEVESEDNVLNVTFIQTDAEGIEDEGAAGKGNSLLVKYFNESFRQQLFGKKKDDSMILQLNAAFDEKEREWLMEDLGLAKNDSEAGDRFYKMTITNVGLVEKPEMDEQFFQRAFPGQTLANEDDFRKAVKDSIQGQWDAQTRNQLQDQVYHQLVDHTHLDFPEEFLKRLVQEGQQEKKSAEETEKEFPSFLSGLKWTLISNQLIEQFDVQVNAGEIKQFAKQQVIGYMQGQLADENAPWLDDYADRMLKDKKFVEDSHRRLQTTKLFNTLEEQVNVIEHTVTPEELMAMQHHHKH